MNDDNEDRPGSEIRFFSQHWRPKLVEELNRRYVRLVKCRGKLPWHRHDTEDELFLV